MNVIVIKSSTGMGSHYWTHCPKCGIYVHWGGSFHFCPGCHTFLEKVADGLDLEFLTCVNHHQNRYQNAADHLKKLASEGKVDKAAEFLQSLILDSQGSKKQSPKELHRSKLISLKMWHWLKKCILSFLQWLALPVRDNAGTMPPIMGGKQDQDKHLK